MRYSEWGASLRKTVLGSGVGRVELQPPIQLIEELDQCQPVASVMAEGSRGSLVEERRAAEAHPQRWCGRSRGTGLCFDSFDFVSSSVTEWQAMQTLLFG